MTESEKRRRNTARLVMIQAWRYLRRNPSAIGKSLALTLGWATVRSKAFFQYTKARGVTFDGRQRLLAKLQDVEAQRITLRLKRDTTNRYDPNAVKVIATVDGIRQACVGFLSRDMACGVSEKLLAGKRYVAFYEGVTGGIDRRYGINLSVVIFG